MSCKCQILHIDVSVTDHDKLISNVHLALFSKIRISWLNEIQDNYIVWVKLVIFLFTHHKYFWHVQIWVIFLCALLMLFLIYEN